jgi:hypothetical protein
MLMLRGARFRERLFMREKEAVPAADLISAECKFTQVRILALLLAEFVAPPMVRQ